MHLIDSYNIIRDLDKIRQEFNSNNVAHIGIEGELIKKEKDFRQYRDMNGMILKYSFERYITERFYKTLIIDDLDNIDNSYGNASENNADYFGYIQRIMRKLENIKEKINALKEEELRKDLLGICELFKPELIKRGINPINLELDNNPHVKEKAKKKGNQPLKITPIRIGEGHDENSFIIWVKRLHLELYDKRNFIKKCSLDDFKKIFTIKPSPEIEAEQIIWKEKNARLAYLLKSLKDNNYLYNRFWSEAATCFCTEDGQLNPKNLKSYHDSASASDKKAVKEIIEGLVVK